MMIDPDIIILRYGASALLAVFILDMFIEKLGHLVPKIRKLINR
jgi:hypothetical protein